MKCFFYVFFFLIGLIQCGLAQQPSDSSACSHDLLVDIVFMLDETASMASDSTVLMRLVPRIAEKLRNKFGQTRVGLMTFSYPPDLQNGYMKQPENCQTFWLRKSPNKCPRIVHRYVYVNTRLQNLTTFFCFRSLTYSAESVWKKLSDVEFNCYLHGGSHDALGAMLVASTDSGVGWNDIGSVTKNVVRFLVVLTDDFPTILDSSWCHESEFFATLCGPILFQFFYKTNAKNFSTFFFF